jgi:hypothetical protein
MAIYRETPKCRFCGKPIAKALHINSSHNFIGDTFARWEYFDCQCKEAKEWRKTTKSNRSDLANIIFSQETTKETVDKIFRSLPEDSSLEEKVVEQINSLLLYNKTQYTKKEILDRAKKIIKLVKDDEIK